MLVFCHNITIIICNNQGFQVRTCFYFFSWYDLYIAWILHVCKHEQTCFLQSILKPVSKVDTPGLVFLLDLILVLTVFTFSWSFKSAVEDNDEGKTEKTQDWKKSWRVPRLKSYKLRIWNQYKNNDKSTVTIQKLIMFTIDLG